MLPVPVIDRVPLCCSGSTAKPGNGAEHDDSVSAGAAAAGAFVGMAEDGPERKALN